MSEGTLPPTWSREPYLTLERRIRLHSEVLRLHQEGSSYGQIIKRIHRFEGVRLDKSNIGKWIHGVHSPLGNVNKFNPKPSPELAYIIGVRLGDGYSYKNLRNYKYGLNTVDYEFAKETGRRLAKLLGRKQPYLPSWNQSSRQWRVTGYSVLLHRFLQQPLENLRPYIEHCKDCAAGFLRGFFDSEGSVEKRRIRAYNTNFELLTYVQFLLQQHFGIENTGPYRSNKAGYRFKSPSNGKFYTTTKDCYGMDIPARCLSVFHRHIGFTIRRKQQRLSRVAQSLPFRSFLVSNSQYKRGKRRGISP